jgi:hypothetical protein
MSYILRIFALSATLFSGITVNLHAQIITGRITDTNGEPAVYATIFIKELKQGSTATEDGYYELKLPEGTYNCTFQSIGYETFTCAVSVGSEPVELNVILKEKAYELKEIIISNTREDPAFNIMRRAIAMAPYYRNQVSGYHAALYLKGSVHVDKISRLVKRLAKEELGKIKEGNTYVLESYNEIDFTAPNTYRQKVLRQTGTIPDMEKIGNIENAMQMVTTSVYDPEGILPYISPLSTSAFGHYRFTYDGYIEEDSRIINKIRITPIHKSKQLFSGYIYIADNYWNVHSVDVSGGFVVGGNFRLQINFGEVNENIWLPVSHRIDFNGSILGNKGDLHYVSSVKYNHIVENTALRKPDALLLAEKQRDAARRGSYSSQVLPPASGTQNKTGKKIEKILSKEDLSNREAYKLARLMQKESKSEKSGKDALDLSETISGDYRTEADSSVNKRDTVYWERLRPVPLTPDELNSYRQKDAGLIRPQQSLAARKDTARMKAQSNFAKTGWKILRGNNIHIGKKGGVLEHRGLRFSQLGFNTVDGFYIGQKLRYYKDFTENKRENRLQISPEIIWAINRKTLMWDISSGLSYAPNRRGNLSLAFGQRSADFSGTNGMYPFENTVASLFFRRNYLKLYDNDFVNVDNTIDIINGLQIHTGLRYAKRKALENRSNYSFFYGKSREYSPNIPKNDELDTPPVDHASASFTVDVSYTPRFYYRIDRSNRKRMVKSDFPTLSVGWRKGVKNVFNSVSDFDLIEAGISQRIETGIMQQFRYSIRGGMFVNRKNISFPDFRHFRIVEVPLTIGSIENNAFHLLPCYRYSTSDKYIEAHLYFDTPFLVLKYLPFLGSRLWIESLQLNYLCTPQIKNYAELGYTIGLIWKAGIFIGFENFKYRSIGAKLTLPLSRLF